VTKAGTKLAIKTNKKPPSINGLAAKIDEGSVQNCVHSGNELHRARITRLGLLKQRAKHQEQYIFDYVEQVEGDTETGKLLGYYANRMAACGHYLLFRDYFRLGETKLVKAHTCQLHLLCPLCAHNRAAKSVRAYTERFEILRKERPRLKPVLITLTVKNGEDLDERFLHLKNAFKNLVDRRRDWLKKGRGFIEFCKIEGAVYSFEFTKSEKTGWHPHIHMVALVNDWVDQDMLACEWEEITKDSNIVDVRLIKPRIQMVDGRKVNMGYAKAFCEVFKYAMKFSDLSYKDTLYAFCVLRGKRLTGSLGCFRGIEVPEGLEDVIDVKDEPYLELLYKFKNNAGYNLAASKLVQLEARSEERRMDVTDATSAPKYPKNLEHHHKGATS
jgi:plasmid rolling circle replication initiator protein Rep